MKIKKDIPFIEDPFELSMLKSRKPFTIKCVKCGQIQTRLFKRNRLEDYKSMKCSSCLKSERISATLSAKSQEEWNSISKKREAFWLHTKGCRSNMQCPEIVQKVKDIWSNKSPEEKNRWRQQSIDFWKNTTKEEKNEYVLRNKESKLDKYGNENYNNAYQISETKRNWNDNKLQRMLDRLHSTNLDLYGDPYYNNSKQMSETKKNWTFKQKQQMLDRLRKSNLELYGVENSMQCPEIVQKVKDIWSNKSPEEKLLVYNKIKESLLKNTGHSHPISGRCYYYGIKLDSAWELAVWIYCIDHNIPIIRMPKIFHFFDINGKFCDYVPDFLINNKLIEIKGDHFFRSDGTMYYPYTKKKVNGNWIELTPEQKAYYNDLYERKHQCGLTNGVEYWKQSDCLKYIQYCENKFNSKYWYKLFLTDNPYNPSYWCGSITNIGHFQPQTFFISSKIGVTPYDINKETKYLMNNGKGITPFDIKR